MVFIHCMFPISNRHEYSHSKKQLPWFAQWTHMNTIIYLMEKNNTSSWLFSVIKGTLDNVIFRIKYVFPHGYFFFPIDNLNLYSFFMFGPMKHSIFHEARVFPSDFLLKTEVHRGFGGGRQPSLLWVEGAIGRACHWGEGAMSLAKRIPVWYLFFGV